MKDYGADPLGDGKFKMVPSGDIVDFEERNRRLPRTNHVQNDCFGLSWEQISMKQGGLQTLDITRDKKSTQKK